MGQKVFQGFSKNVVAQRFRDNIFMKILKDNFEPETSSLSFFFVLDISLGFLKLLNVTYLYCIVF